MLSMSDFIDVHNSGIVPIASEIASTWTKHVLACPVRHFCSPLGFFLSLSGGGDI